LIGDSGFGQNADRASLARRTVSALRRVCGPDSDRILLNCPAHLLYGAKQVIDPHRLPPKVLAIAGGLDVQIPYSQTVLVSSLLTGVGVRDVRQRLYREETHLGSLASKSSRALSKLGRVVADGWLWVGRSDARDALLDEYLHGDCQDDG
jgi:hypothetical protein